MLRPPSHLRLPARLFRGLLPLLALAAVACGAPSVDKAGTSETTAAPPATPTPASPEPRPGRPEERATTRIVFLGDSLSAGFGLAPEQAFPALAEAVLVDRGLAVEVVNAGVSGDTTAGGRSRIEWVLRQEPDILVLELGGNDGLRGLPPERTEQNLRRMIERAREADARVLLLGMRLPPNYGREYVEAFEAIYPRLAEETGVAYVPFFLEGIAGRPELNLPDGLHPNAEGHRLAAAALVEVLAEMVAGR